MAGIAVGSAAGGILLATILTFAFLRFCLGYRRVRNDPDGASKRPKSSNELDSATTMSSPQPEDQRYHWASSTTEMDSAGQTRTELPFSARIPIDRAELEDKEAKL